jgi:hypothetical protein
MDITRDDVAAELAALKERGSDDHFYGAWRGGAKAQGGGPAKSVRDSGTAVLERPKTAEKPNAGDAKTAVDKAALEVGRGTQDYETTIAIGADGKEVFRKSGDQTRVEFYGHEQSKMVGSHVVHNHPSGGSFSVSDFDLAADLGARSIVAIGTNDAGDRWKHTLTATKQDYLVGHPRARRLQRRDGGRQPELLAQHLDARHRLASPMGPDLYPGDMVKRLDGDPKVTLTITAQEPGKARTVDSVKDMDPDFAKSALAIARKRPWFVRGEITKQA